MVNLHAEIWAVCFRSGVNHPDHNTTSLCEGYHSVVKATLRAQGGKAIRLDHLHHYLLACVAQTYVHKDVRRRAPQGMELGNASR
jgi:hypothetical protein